MVEKELVQNTYDELKVLIDECERHKENPRIIKLARLLLRLCNLSGEMEETQEPTEVVTSAPAAIDPANCPHKVTDLYGRCKDCKRCTHPTAQVRNGTCMTCDMVLEKS